MAMMLIGIMPQHLVAVEHEGGNEAKKRCALCPRSLDRKTKVRCSTCEKPLCGDHQMVYCASCMMGNDDAE